MIRAARRLPETSVPAIGPVAFAGYSQGGHAAASTAELLDSYGPELDVVGVYVGAMASTTTAIMERNDGGALMGVVGYYLNGLAAQYPAVEAELDSVLNNAGKAFRAATAEQCVPETGADYGFRQSSSYTVGSESLGDVLRSPAIALFANRDSLGSVAPSVPVLLAVGANDDVVPASGSRELAAAWCAGGTNLDYFERPGPILPISTAVTLIAYAPVLYSEKARGWLQDRLAGVLAVSNCSGP